MKKESSTTRKVVDLAEEKCSRMTEGELLSHVVGQLVTQTNQLVLLTAEISRRLSKLEKINQPSSVSNALKTSLVP